MREHDFTRHKIFTEQKDGGLTTEPSIPFTEQATRFGYVGPRDTAGALSYRILAMVEAIAQEVHSSNRVIPDIERIELQYLADFERHEEMDQRPEFFYVWFHHFYTDLIDGIHEAHDFSFYITQIQSDEERILKYAEDWGLYHFFNGEPVAKEFSEFELMPEETTLILTKELLYELESGKYRLDP